MKNVTTNEKPILFTGDMVRAILDGRKTQTRRIVKFNHVGCGKHCHPAVTGIAHRGDGWWGFDGTEMGKGSYSTTFPFHTIRCPYGKPGDRLWVRETWAAAPTRNGIKPSWLNPGERIEYRATYANSTHFVWRPSIFMPRWASRITLEVVSVRVERVQDISEDDARAEGVRRDDEPCDRTRLSCADVGCLGQTFKSSFFELWEHINAVRGYNWRSNPWVWVVTFKRR